MLKLIYVILMNLHRAPYMIPKMRNRADHPEKYTEEQRYALVHHVIYLMNKTGKITTEAYGLENLPQEGGYMMYPNHQGKYDVLGIMYTHKKPCSFVMDKNKSHTILVREFCDLVQGKRLEKDNPRQGITIINQVADDVAAGKRYILFPEGGYKFNNKNKVCDFKAGSFKIALKSKAPIIPIALIDSYKVFNSFHVGPLTTQVHYLKPIMYEEYKDLKTQEIAELVKQRIQEKIDEVLAESSQS
ncbi:MAG: lysophospholipid acyltransferase family protein [Lachnospiraceae bacterium]|nr:lysophospholipid acyltransferase family protein [Lachnospiraceae bacterium]MDD7332968.1 lysophospholipid acyltransferase family protein [Lachnospiraceae bacterium]MDY3275885.1 lysophospholipid acyltransferase family protein [Agathobacter sp.]MDY5102343.1 lysophospholipid acyltransferase family protein [Agathobacter sp.]MDY5521692.1 lysophospholipid acyltransferase family protein [Agathobacter sp.]